MALNISTALTNVDGETLTSAYVRLEMQLKRDETSIVLRLLMWRSETDYDNNRRQIWVEEIPRELHIIEDTINATLYANVDMTLLHNVVAAIIEDGDVHNKYPSNYPAYAGLGASTVVVDMPV